MNATTRETTPQAGDMLDCGHVLAAQPPTSGGTGYARRPDGRTLCYACADDAQRAELLTESTVVAYLHRAESYPRELSVTTWTGGHLGSVTSHNVSCGLTPTGGEYERHSVRMTDVHGQHWHGTGPGEGMYVTLRKGR